MQHTRLIIILSGLIHTLAYADISTDGSVGSAQVLNANKGQYTIAQTLGSLRGSNLFHSFQQFNINQGESATFTGSNSIQNVISRVTGGSASIINGILKSQIGTADFYFINPAGVIFGAEAQVDVPAAFHVSTAGELKFSDGGSFNALNPDASTLTVAEPQGFGFTQGQSGKLQIIGGQLSFKPGTNVSLSTNSLTITGIEQDNGEIRQAAIFVQQSNIATEQGIHLNLTAVDTASNQLVPINDQIETATGGELYLNNSVINSSGNGFGKIGIQAGEAVLDNSLLLASNTGDQSMSDKDGIAIQVKSLGLDNTVLLNNALGKGNTGMVLVKASEIVQLSNGALIASATFNAGNAGDVEVGANKVLIDGQGSGINSSALADSQGEVGSVTVRASDSVLILNGGTINSSTFSTRNAGNVTVTGKEVLVDGQGFVAGIFSDTGAGSQGKAGIVLVNASNVVRVQDGGIISSDTFGAGDANSVSVTGEEVQILDGGGISSSTFSAGDAGNVTVMGKKVLIDGQGFVTGIFSNAKAGSQGNAGIVLVNASEAVQILDGGLISSDTFSTGDAGSVTVEGGEVVIDGQGGGSVTSIGSDTESGSKGNAGTVLVTAIDTVQVLNGGEIRSLTFSAGNAGSITVEASEVLVDGSGSAISSSAQPDSQGKAGIVLVKASEVVQVLDGGAISSSAFSVGDAGSVVVESGKTVQVLNEGLISSDTSSIGNAGSVMVRAGGIVQVLDGGVISSDTSSVGDAGSVTVEGRDVLVDGQGKISGIYSNAYSNSQGKAGTVSVNASNVVQTLNGGIISSDTFSVGDAGSVTVQGRAVLVDGQSNIAGIFSDANTDSQGKAGTVSVYASEVVQVLNGGLIRSDTSGIGDAGSVTVNAGEIVQIINGGIVSSDTSSVGNAGSVTVEGRAVLVDGHGKITGIFSDANTGSQGRAGSVSVSVSEIVQVLNGGLIRSDTSSVGDAGSVVIKAAEVLVDGQGNGTANISSSAQQGSKGNAGTVLVTTTETIQLLSGGGIDSITFGSGDAGSVTVKANEILVDGQGSLFSTGISSSAQPDSQGGNAGTVLVAANNTVQVLNGAVIDSDTHNAGHAGDVTVEARDVLIDGQGSEFATGIKSGAQIGSQGDAGTVLVRASELVQVLDGGTIDSVTIGTGNAGNVVVEAEKILIDGQGRRDFTGIFSSSTSVATGQVGNVSIVATEQIILRDSGIGIESLNGQLQGFTTDSETSAKLSISTPVLQLEKNAAITAATLGGVNAASIEVNVTDSLNIENSKISTSAANGNGGSISTNAGNWLRLYHSQITTSVSGEKNGNGGDINITTPVSILDTGFIQANTAASQAQGGDINLQISQLIPSANSLLVGGRELLEFDPEQSNFNVVQAASPSGVNGSINISSPELNITGVLASVSIPELNLERLGQDPCIRQRENSLQSLGHGGVPALQHGENYMQISHQQSMSKEQRNNSVEVIQHPEISVKHLQRESVLTDCKKPPLSFSQMGR